MDSKMTDQKIELVDDTQVLNEDFKKNLLNLRKSAKRI
jgi:hypothetical protein